jgi:type VI secretion system ImpC/EvpB family protein
MEDFEPASVLRRVDGLKELVSEQEQLRDLLVFIDCSRRRRLSLDTGIDDFEQWERRLSQLVREIRPPASQPLAINEEHELQSALRILSRWMAQEPQFRMGTVRERITRILHHIDQITLDQVQVILRDPDFQAMEASWRGLHYLVNHTGGDVPTLAIEVLNISREELAKAWEHPEATHPVLKRIRTEPASIPGADPVACLIADYYFDHSSSDVQLLTRVAKMAADAHTLFISAAAPSLMNFDTWREVTRPHDLETQPSHRIEGKMLEGRS